MRPSGVSSCLLTRRPLQGGSYPAGPYRSFKVPGVYNPELPPYRLYVLLQALLSYTPHLKLPITHEARRSRECSHTQCSGLRLLRGLFKESGAPRGLRRSMIRWPYEPALIMCETLSCDHGEPRKDKPEVVVNPKAALATPRVMASCLSSSHTGRSSLG